MCLSTGCLGEDEHSGPAPHIVAASISTNPSSGPTKSEPAFRIKDKSHTCFRNSDHKTGLGLGALGGGRQSPGRVLLHTRHFHLSGGSSKLQLCGCDLAASGSAPPSRPCSQGIAGRRFSGTFQSSETLGPEPLAHPLLLPRWSLPSA